MDERGVLEIVHGRGPRPTLRAATARRVQVLLDVYLLEKALYELRYELNNRPEWARIPLHGIQKLLGEPVLSTTA